MPKYLLYVYACPCLVVNDVAGMKDFIMTARNSICLQIIVRWIEVLLKLYRMGRLNKILGTVLLLWQDMDGGWWMCVKCCVCKVRRSWKARTNKNETL